MDTPRIPGPIAQAQNTHALPSTPTKNTKNTDRSERNDKPGQQDAE